MAIPSLTGYDLWEPSAVGASGSEPDELQSQVANNFEQRGAIAEIDGFDVALCWLVWQIENERGLLDNSTAPDAKVSIYSEQIYGKGLK